MTDSDLNEEQQRAMLALYQIALHESKRTGQKIEDIYIDPDFAEALYEDDKDVPLEKLIRRVQSMVEYYPKSKKEEKK